MVQNIQNIVAPSNEGIFDYHYDANNDGTAEEISYERLDEIYNMLQQTCPTGDLACLSNLLSTISEIGAAIRPRLITAIGQIIISSFDGSYFDLSQETWLPITAQRLGVIYDSITECTSVDYNCLLSLSIPEINYWLLLKIQDEITTRISNSTLDSIQLSVQNYKSLLENLFGYAIALRGDFSDTQRLTQFYTLAVSHLHIVDYFDAALAGTPPLGLSAFREYFSKSPYSLNPGNQITVILSAEEDEVLTVPEDEGITPLPASYPEGSTDPEVRAERLSSLRLGTAVIVSTITHEFFHQLDRKFEQQLSDESSGIGMKAFLLTKENFAGTMGIGFSPVLILGRANPGSESAEIFADIGMTAVLNGLGYIARGNSVGWNYEGSQNAVLVEQALPEYFQMRLVL